MLEHKKEETILAMDVGGTAAKYAFVAADGTITARANFSTARIKDLDTFLKELCIVVESARRENITKIAMACPGAYDETGNCVGLVENLPYLSNQNIPALVQAKFPEMQCKIGNDAVAAAMGEYQFGAAKGCDSFICITLGTGIGGAYVLNGKPHLGRHGQSFEVGYMDYKNADDYCEKKYSTKGILRGLAEKLNVPTVSGRVFTQKVQEGDLLFGTIYDMWTDALGQMIANMILVVDPAMVVIGGGISREADLLAPSIDTAIKKHLPPSFREQYQLKMASCGNDAGLLGAAAFWNEEG